VHDFKSTPQTGDVLGQASQDKLPVANFGDAAVHVKHSNAVTAASASALEALQVPQVEGLATQGATVAVEEAKQINVAPDVATSHELHPVIVDTAAPLSVA